MNRNLRRALLGMLITAVMVAMVAGCGSQRREPTIYRPAAFGEQNRCYFVHDKAEVQYLYDDGLCPRNWAPAPMPAYWHDRYYSYYSSPRYVTTYVPKAQRGLYQNQEKAYYGTRQGLITKAQTDTKAPPLYKGSNGKTVTADKIGVTKYGSGNARGAFGGGVRCSPARAWMIHEKTKAGSSGGGSSSGSRSSGGGSFGGGSARSGGGGSGGGSRGYGGGGARSDKGSGSGFKSNPGAASKAGGTNRSWTSGKAC